MDNIMSGALGWSIGLTVVFPLLLILTGEVLLRLRRTNHPLVSPIVETRSVLIPVLATLVIMVKVMGLDANTISVRLVETLFWLIVVHAALSFLNAILFARAKEGSWQARLPGLFVDLIRVVLVLVCAAIVLSTVWGQDLRQLVTALGVGSIVIGLALQEPLGNLFSGIMLMIERPLSVGDWLTFTGMEGVVIATNWRAIHLQTRNKDLIVVPNSVLAKQSFTNQSRPTRLHREVVRLGFSPDDPPNHVKRIIQDTALRTPGILHTPAPRVELLDFAESTNIYTVKFHIASAGDNAGILDQFRTLVWYAARRHGLTMPYPTQRQIRVKQAELDAAEDGPLSPEILRMFPRFGLDTSEIAGKPLSRSEVKHYARGEHVVFAGDRLTGIYLILNGEAVLTALDRLGKDREIARLGRGEFFGEQSLAAGSASDVTVVAARDLELLILDSDGLQDMLDRTPQLSREIGHVMEARRKAISGMRAPAQHDA
jgi:small-conductance mechanosensitive channel